MTSSVGTEKGFLPMSIFSNISLLVVGKRSKLVFLYSLGIKEIMGWLWLFLFAMSFQFFKLIDVIF